MAYRDATHPPDDGRRRLLAAVFTWSNFLDPLIYLFEEDKFTSPLGLKALARLVRPDFPLLLAGAVAATAPVVAAFLYVQRYFASRRASSRR